MLWSVLGMLLLGAAFAPSVHLALRESEPAAGERLSEPPTTIQLSFTEAVELGLSEVVLTDPAGTVVPLGPLTANDERTIVTADISGPLTVAGTYSVAWQAVGRDGHPVRGAFEFILEESAVAVATPEDTATSPLSIEDEAATGAVGASTGPEQTERPSAGAMPTFSTRSPLYAGIRWLMYVGVTVLVGSLGMALLLRSGSLRAATDAPFREAVGKAAAAAGILAVAPLVIAIALRLQAQSHAVFGGGVTGERFGALLGSLWGVAWVAQLVGCAVVLVGLLVARAGRTAGWVVAAVGALPIVASPALSGHAAAADTTVAVLMDSIHLLSVGLWMGTLFVIVTVAIPIARKHVARGERNHLPALVEAFSPLALAAATMIVLTGGYAAILNLNRVADLWSTGYGRVLSAKLLFVALVLGLGGYNWRVMRPRLAQAGAEARLRRSGAAELAAAALAILLTAVLVSVEPPAHSARAAIQQPDVMAGQ